MADSYRDLNELLAAEPFAPSFTPYCSHDEEYDTLTIKVRPDADFSERLTDHVTLFRSLDSRELTGVRIKGVKELIEDLPNYIQVDHDGIKLSILLYSFRSAVADKDRLGWQHLAQAADKLHLPCAA